MGLRLFTLLFLLVSLQSCFSRYVMTEKELKAYYAQRSDEPAYHRITNDSLSLFCATRGADTLPALLLIHGAPGAWYGSRNFLEDTCLTHHFQVIAPDRPGYNQTRYRNKRKALPSISEQARLLHLALQLNRSGQKAIVLGSSYGGPIAAKMAIDHPDDYSAVFLLAAAADPRKEKFWWFHPFIKGGPVKWMLPRFLRNATTEKFKHASELQRLEPEWQNLSVPLTALQGGADTIVDPGNLSYLRQQLDGKKARFFFLPEAGHLLRWQYPDLVISLLRASPSSE